MTREIMAEIKELLSKGHTKLDIVAMGYAESTVRKTCQIMVRKGLLAFTPMNPRLADVLNLPVADAFNLVARIAKQSQREKQQLELRIRELETRANVREQILQQAMEQLKQYQNATLSSEFWEMYQDYKGLH